MYHIVKCKDNREYLSFGPNQFHNRNKGLLSLNTLIKVKWGSSVLRLERIKSDDLVHLINKEA